MKKFLTGKIIQEFKHGYKIIDEFKKTHSFILKHSISDLLNSALQNPKVLIKFTIEIESFNF
jgi:hypothetical protein